MVFLSPAEFAAVLAYLAAFDNDVEAAIEALEAFGELVKDETEKRN